MTRILTIAICLAATVTHADTREERTMRLNSEGIRTFEIEAGAGDMEIKGRTGGSEIKVEAEIIVKRATPGRARHLIDERVELRLSQRGSTATLISEYDAYDQGWIQGLLSGNPNVEIDLYITVPEGIALNVDDGSGNIKIENCVNDMEIDDGSGNVRMRHVTGNIMLDDGSGNATLSDIIGNVTIDDGSGNLEIYDVRGDVNVDDGSGNMEIEHIEGSVEVDDGSGNIDIRGVSDNVYIADQGSGDCDIRDVQGSVREET